MQDGNTCSESLVCENNSSISNVLHMLPAVLETFDRGAPLGAFFAVNGALKSKFKQKCGLFFGLTVSIYL